VKRLLPFLIILVVGLLTFGTATALYRQKTKPSTKPQTPAPAGSVATEGTTATPEAEDSGLHVRGPRDAALKVEVYGDFQCPACSTASRVIDELQQQEYRGKMKVIFHEFPLAMHRHAKEAAMTAEAAGLQGKFWEMHDMLYKYQEVWSQVSDVRVFFENYARAVGLDVEQFKADRDSVRVENIVIEDGTDGEVRGVRNTPTIFINGVESKTAFTKEKLKEAIDAALAPKKP
jgi:protein-disulfide isomerase